MAKNALSANEMLNYYAKIKNFQDLEINWTNERKKWQKQQQKEQEERKIREVFTSLKNMLVIGGQSHYIK